MFLTPLSKVRRLYLCEFISESSVLSVGLHDCFCAGSRFCYYGSVIFEMEYYDTSSVALSAKDYLGSVLFPCES